jgi:hypothetical protein
MDEGKFLMLTPSVGVEQFWDVSKMESMWMHTSRVEAAYMGWSGCDLDFNRMTNPLGST